MKPVFEIYFWTQEWSFKTLFSFVNSGKLADTWFSFFFSMSYQPLPLNYLTSESPLFSIIPLGLKESSLCFKYSQFPSGELKSSLYFWTTSSWLSIKASALELYKRLAIRFSLQIGYWVGMVSSGSQLATADVQPLP